MSVSCNAKFSDSTGDSSDSKMAFPLKKIASKHSVFRIRAFISRKTRCCFSQKCEPVAAVLRPIRSTTAHHPQYYCGGFAVI